MFKTFKCFEHQLNQLHCFSKPFEFQSSIHSLRLYHFVHSESLKFLPLVYMNHLGTVVLI